MIKSIQMRTITGEPRLRADLGDAPAAASVADLVPQRPAPARVPPRLARTLMLPLLSAIRGGALVIREQGGTRRAGDDPGVAITVHVRDAHLWSAILTRGGIGLGEGYIHGQWETDDLAGVLRLLAENVKRTHGLTNRLAALRAAMGADGRGRKRSAQDDRRYVGAHYDLGDEFFELFLDPTMAYSAGIFADSDTTLEEASVAKFDRICATLGLGPGDHLLEIGTGWGGFALHAAREYGCRVTTTTISARQYGRARQRVAEAGLGERITVLNRDYRDVRGQYSHLASIEMIEAVDWRDHDTFFAACNRLLVPGGRAVLQAIVIGDRDYERTKNSDDFIKRYIFPGGCLPSLAAIDASLARTGDLRVTDVDDFGQHYARTLHEWRRRLDRRWKDALAAGHDERFLRMWRYYFAYCEAGFAARHISVVQALLQRTVAAQPDAGS